MNKLNDHKIVAHSALFWLATGISNLLQNLTKLKASLGKLKGFKFVQMKGMPFDKREGG